jgi:spore maturation protein CgeB
LLPPARKALVRRLERKCGLRIERVLGDAMVRTVSSYWIHFNKNYANDINYRSFETLGCATVLMTNFNKQYLDLGFIHRENCLMYKNEQHLLDLFGEYGNDYVQLRKIAASGYELSKRHTYLERAKLIENIVKKRMVL